MLKNIFCKVCGHTWAIGKNKEVCAVCGKTIFYPEICICAAVKFTKDNGEELVIRGHRHGDCFYNKFKRDDNKLWKEKEQGFITSKNRFVSREEGRKLQDAAGIKSVSDEGYVPGTLFSEDLY